MTDRIRTIYDDIAPTYDRTVGFSERLALGRLRQRFGAALKGDVLEIGAGSGLNFPHYPDDDTITSVTALDLSPNMLAIARHRAERLAGERRNGDIWRDATFIEEDAERLPFPDAAFDTVAISLALCTVPDPERALSEAIRVCRLDGRLVLLEHVLSPVRPVAWVLRALAPVQMSRLACDLTRQTDALIRASGLRIESDNRRLFGIFHLIVARLPEQRPAHRQ